MNYTIHFGEGRIFVSTLLDADKRPIGIGLTNHGERHEIGAGWPEAEGQDIDALPFPTLCLLFDGVESLDVLIGVANSLRAKLAR